MKEARRRKTQCTCRLSSSPSPLSSTTSSLPCLSTRDHRFFEQVQLLLRQDADFNDPSSSSSDYCRSDPCHAHTLHGRNDQITLSYSGAVQARAQIPCMVFDLDAFNQNIDAVRSQMQRPKQQDNWEREGGGRRGGREGERGAKIRIATKSIRVPGLVRYMLERDPDIFQGLMCYSVKEAEFYADYLLGNKALRSYKYHHHHTHQKYQRQDYSHRFNSEIGGDTRVGVGEESNILSGSSGQDTSKSFFVDDGPYIVDKECVEGMLLNRYHSRKEEKMKLMKRRDRILY